jgi:uncharacterized protein (TIGR02271 family)
LHPIAAIIEHVEVLMRDFGEELRRFSEMDDVQVAEDDPDVRGWDVVMPDGRDIGEVKDLLVDTGSMKVRALEVELDGNRFNWNDNRRVAIPVDAVQIDEDGDNVIVSRATFDEIGGLPVYSQRSTATRAATPPAGDANRERLTRSEEELRVGTREVQAGEVRVSKHVETEHVSQDVSRQRERVRIERRPATGASAGARIENDEIRVPVTEEEVIVEKRPVVKEELVVSKERVTEPDRVEADVRKERFDIDQEGHVLDERGRGKGER